MVEWRELPPDQYFGWGPEYTKNFLEEAAEQAEVSDLEVERAIHTDGFYYVHSQAWYPVLSRVFGINEDLQAISERSAEAGAAWEAYGLPEDEYMEVTEELGDGVFEMISTKNSRHLEAELRGYIEQDPSDLIKELRGAQKNLRERSRERLAEAVLGPSSVNLSWTLSKPYLVDWRYRLAIHWDKNGDPPMHEGSSVHSRLGRISNTIYGYYQSKNLIKKDLVDQIMDLGIDIEQPAVWGGDTTAVILNPKFPIDDHAEGRFYGSIHEGRTTESSDKRSLTYNFSASGPNSNVRRSAFIGLFDEFRDFDLDEHRGQCSMKGLEDAFGVSPGEEKYERSYFCIPSPLTGVYRARGFESADDIGGDALISLLSSEKFARGYVEQSIWDRGQVYSKGIRFNPRDPKLFRYALDSAGMIPENEYNEKVDGRGRLVIPKDVVEKYNELKEFRAFYLEANRNFSEP